MRTLVIGDIHGAYRALQQVFERSGYDPMKDRLICLGDYVDGWSESAQVVELLLEKESISSLSSVAPDMTIFIRGNHDDWCDQWMRYGDANPHWLNQGGQSTFDSYMAYPQKGLHHKFFRKLHNFYKDDQNRVFVHGGFTSRKGVGHEPKHTNYFWDRDLWQLAMMSHGRIHTSGPKLDDSGKEYFDVNPYGMRYLRHHEIFIGHTATTMWNCKKHYPEYEDSRQPSKNGPIMVPMNRCNIWNLDTGAGWDGKLTIMDIDTKEYWQSDLVTELYPEEKGRRG